MQCGLARHDGNKNTLDQKWMLMDVWNLNESHMDAPRACQDENVHLKIFLDKILISICTACS